MWIALIGIVAAHPFDGLESDVEASRYVAASPEAIYEVAVDLDRALALMPCADEPIVTSNPLSEGGAFDVTYTVGFMNRQLSGAIRSAIPGQVVDWDHEGERGFITRWKIEPEGAGTRVTLTTYLNPPPFPVRRYFYNRVQPRWIVCHQDALQSLAAAVE